MVFLKLRFKNYQIPTMREKAIIFRRVRMVSAIFRLYLLSLEKELCMNTNFKVFRFFSSPNASLRPKIARLKV